MEHCSGFSAGIADQARAFSEGRWSEICGFALGCICGMVAGGFKWWVRDRDLVTLRRDTPQQVSWEQENQKLEPGSPQRTNAHTTEENHSARIGARPWLVHAGRWGWWLETDIGAGFSCPIRDDFAGA